MADNFVSFKFPSFNLEYQGKDLDTLRQDFLKFEHAQPKLNHEIQQPLNFRKKGIDIFYRLQMRILQENHQIKADKIEGIVAKRVPFKGEYYKKFFCIFCKAQGDSARYVKQLYSVV